MSDSCSEGIYFEVLVCGLTTEYAGGTDVILTLHKLYLCVCVCVSACVRSCVRACVK